MKNLRESVENLMTHIDEEDVCDVHVLHWIGDDDCQIVSSKSQEFKDLLEEIQNILDLG